MKCSTGKALLRHACDTKAGEVKPRLPQMECVHSDSLPVASVFNCGPQNSKRSITILTGHSA